jgi:hypothetical protein
VTGSVDASAIAGATNVIVHGSFLQTMVGGVQGNFTLTLATAPTDIVIVAIDGSNQPLAVKILRSQAVPGAVNNGNPVVFTANDATGLQPIAMSSLPSGFNPQLSAKYITATGTLFPLISAPVLFLSNTQYATVPSSEIQPRDSYSFDATAFARPRSGFQFVETGQYATSATPVTLALPAPLAYSPPTPAAFPSFPVNYPGFSGGKSFAYLASMTWSTQDTINFISLQASSAYQEGANALVIPDLSSLPGFRKPASGSQVGWEVDVRQVSTSQNSAASESGGYIVP